MYRIRLHGRGGQGIKTAGRILGTAFFLAGFEVQDAPRYGAERRGAPIFAYVRASRRRIRERSGIRHADLVVLADDTLSGLPAAGLLEGKEDRTVYLFRSVEPAEVWKERLAIPGPLVLLPHHAARDVASDATALSSEKPSDKNECLSSMLAAGAGRLTALSWEHIQQAIRIELGVFGDSVVDRNLHFASMTYQALEPHAGIVRESPDLPVASPSGVRWIEMKNEGPLLGSPDIHGEQTSVLVRTGLWRSHRPLLNAERCHQCTWICSTYCPDSAITAREGLPVFDYDHCKGCMVCAAVCPNHAIEIIPEVTFGINPERTPGRETARRGAVPEKEDRR